MTTNNHIPNLTELADLARETGDYLRINGLRCTTAESCTGGWVAKLLTDIAGSSEWFTGGYVCYSNQAKQSMLGVPAHLLAAHGAVSEEVVVALSEAALLKSAADIAVAISGIAGPGGGSVQKPVGSVWIAWSASDKPTKRQLFQLNGNRTDVRAAAVGYALRGILSI